MLAVPSWLDLLLMIVYFFDSKSQSVMVFWFCLWMRFAFLLRKVAIYCKDLLASEGQVQLKKRKEKKESHSISK